MMSPCWYDQGLRQMWKLATIQTDDGPAGCLVVDGAVYPLAALSQSAGVACPAQVIDVIADWPTHQPVINTLAERVATTDGLGVL